MTVKEQLKEFGIKTNQMREDLLSKNLNEKYAAMYLKEHADEFRSQCIRMCLDFCEKEYPEIADYWKNHGPLCDPDCGPCKEAGTR